VTNVKSVLAILSDAPEKVDAVPMEMIPELLGELERLQAQSG
jgi:hypothetical protein